MTLLLPVALINSSSVCSQYYSSQYAVFALLVPASHHNHCHTNCRFEARFNSGLGITGEGLDLSFRVGDSNICV
jgi:hypothetical protein